MHFGSGAWSNQQDSKHQSREQRAIGCMAHRTRLLFPLRTKQMYPVPDFRTTSEKRRQTHSLVHGQDKVQE